MRNTNWGKVEQPSGSPTKGGYVAVIKKVEDVEDKEYLKLYLDIADGQFKGYYQTLEDKHGFWGLTAIKSYKETAERFFKSMLTAIEKSNAGFKADAFDNDPQKLVGKKVGITVGVEHYTKSDHTAGSKLYVAMFRSTKEILEGNFTIPDDKDSTNTSSASASAPVSVPGFMAIAEDLEDEGLPFN